MIGVILAIAILSYYFKSCVDKENDHSTCKV
jgi:hypothetical protein